ncbi:MAG: ABC transporter permease [Muribaculaceae bacterium]|nr:ABC transporter permease [Muribaculaceae bacterium]
MYDLVNEILATMRHNKLRTALTGFAVSWGIFLLIVLLSVSQGLVNGMESMFGQFDYESMEVYGGWAQKPYQGLKDSRQVAIMGADIPVVESQNGDFVSHVAAEISSGGTVVSTPRDYVTQGYDGVYPSGMRTDGLTLESGRFINEVDMKERRRVMVIHKDNADILFGQGADPIGERVTMNDLTFTVVGVYSHEWNRKGLIPFTTARALAGGSDTLGGLIVGLKGLRTLEDGQKAEEAIRATLGRRHRFDASDKSAVWVWNRFTQYLTTSSAMDVLRMAVWVIGLLTMLSGIVGVSNIMFVSVRERTHEIGVRRAIGARPLSILKQVILESVSITTFFGYIGIVAGIAVATIIGKMTEGSQPAILKDPSINLSMAVEVTVVLILAGALAGLFPALKSLKIKPVEALRDE